MAFKLKYKNLKGVIEQLKGASKKHKKQAEILEKHVDKMKSPLEQDDLDYTGLNFDPSAGYTTTGVKIPSFRDMVSLEQQQAMAKRTDERRARRRKEKEFKKLEEAGGGTLDDLKAREQERLNKLKENTVIKTPDDEKDELNINTSSNYGI
tara:strand:+ start:305 stop:757 length:453 start_codon:yes stop_codon:yes gene_type:complete